MHKHFVYSLCDSNLSLNHIIISLCYHSNINKREMIETVPQFIV